MIDLNKSREYFNPDNIKFPCHIIGCGAIGSSIAELLARQGVQIIHLWDFDIVESHNIVNQMFRQDHLGIKKTIALNMMIKEINPEAEVVLHGRYVDHQLNGYVFLATDSIASRKLVVENNLNNPKIVAFFDFRMTLLEGQHYAANWQDEKAKESFYNTMDFTDEEAKVNNPVSACGFDLSVAPTVRMITALGIANFMSFINTGKLKKLTLSSPFTFFVEAI